MFSLLRLVLVGGLALRCVWLSSAQVPSGTDPKAALDTSKSPDLPPLPPLPSGKSTILGGEIRNVDSVLDQLTLRVYGMKPMKIVYDNRTQVFKDGKRIPLRDLHECEHASVQTTLDGPSVFAISIHILSQATPGDYQGQVLSYDSATGELTVGGAANRNPFALLVSKDTTFVREGQGASSSKPAGPYDLQRGTLVSVKFDSDNRGHGVANRIAILATPGSRFIFTGNLVAVDMQSNTLILVDPRDDHRYEIRLNSTSLPVAQSLHAGQRVRVTADYDGSNYQAHEITVY